jgi:hypothetical protein
MKFYTNYILVIDNVQELAFCKFVPPCPSKELRLISRLKNESTRSDTIASILYRIEILTTIYARLREKKLYGCIDQIAWLLKCLDGTFNIYITIGCQLRQKYIIFILVRTY